MVVTDAAWCQTHYPTQPDRIQGALSDGGYCSTAPAWSLDGQLIAFSRFR